MIGKKRGATMKEFEKALKKIGILAGVDEEWYEIGEAEYDDVADGNVRYGIYAKTDEIADKVGKVLDELIAERKTENSSEKPNNSKERGSE